MCFALTSGVVPLLGTGVALAAVPTPTTLNGWLDNGPGGFGASTLCQGGGPPNISVPTGQGVFDCATLTGANASTATGTVTYNVYSDPACTTLVASAGGGTITGVTLDAPQGDRRSARLVTLTGGSAVAPCRREERSSERRYAAFGPYAIRLTVLQYCTLLPWLGRPSRDTRHRGHNE
jgi:hypothetical protein